MGRTDLLNLLGFGIERREGVEVLYWPGHGCRPATEPEQAMWNALRAAADPKDEQ